MKHGKRWTYKHHKCRCGPCTAANTAAQRDYDRRRRADPDREPRSRAPRCLSLDNVIADEITGLDVIVPGIQRHMIEWYDPTADAALERLAS